MGHNKHPKANDQNKNSASTIVNLDAFWKGMDQLFSSFTEKLEAKIDSYTANLEKRIDWVEHRIDAIKNYYHSDVDNLTRTVNDCHTDHLKLRQLEQLERSQDLVITGIPYRQDEDLLTIYRNIARSIGVPKKEDSLVYLKRLSKHPVCSGSSPPILCQFAFRGVRDDFFKRYLHRRSLRLCHIGLHSNDRVYVNENLSPFTKRILNVAIELRSEGRLHRVSTKNGLVSIMVHKESDAVVVDSLDQLLLLKSNLS